LPDLCRHGALRNVKEVRVSVETGMDLVNTAREVGLLRLGHRDLDAVAAVAR
jgi:hypothetical protein